jgi:OPT oligopeptide transporter protein
VDDRPQRGAVVIHTGGSSGCLGRWLSRPWYPLTLGAILGRQPFSRVLVIPRHHCQMPLSFSFIKYFSKTDQWLFILSTQLIGFSIGGICHHILVAPASMIWPYFLASCAIFNTLHSQDTTGSLAHDGIITETSEKRFDNGNPRHFGVII